MMGMDKKQGGAGPGDVWAAGEAYEPYVGRWSRLVAREFLAWLAVPAGGRWLDVGCGTGALTESILAAASPVAVTGVDAAEGYLAFARQKVADPRANFESGDAQALPVDSAAFDAAVSALVLNFVRRPEAMVAEMARAVRPGGLVAAYVWDYAGAMQLMRHFWNAATALDREAAALDEGRRFPLCNPGPLGDLFRAAGLGAVEVQPIDIWTPFKDFDDYWTPFLGGQGPAPTYAMALDEQGRAGLRERLRAALPAALDGTIPLIARAWAVRGIR
jgi:SAM-dependent methyltransferase